MLFHVRMDVHIPLDMPADKANEIKAVEKLIRKTYNAKVNGVISGELQVSTEHQHFDVESNEELHNILQGLPLYPYMDIEVMALNRHPSSVRDDDS